MDAYLLRKFVVPTAASVTDTSNQGE
jgi:hypothetical protein